MKNLSPLLPGIFYHIYNRGNNSEDLFREDRNYPFFLSLYEKYILPIADTYAYCLLKNHFHFLLRMKDEVDLANNLNWAEEDGNLLSRVFSNLFNAYSKAINKTYSRTGSLFEKPFHRIPVTQDAYLLELIYYIHFNPQKHGMISDFKKWRWSSYFALDRNIKTNLMRDEVIELFGSKKAFEEFHMGNSDDRKYPKIIELE